MTQKLIRKVLLLQAFKLTTFGKALADPAASSELSQKQVISAENFWSGTVKLFISSRRQGFQFLMCSMIKATVFGISLLLGGLTALIYIHHWQRPTTALTQGPLYSKFAQSIRNDATVGASEDGPNDEQIQTIAVEGERECELCVRVIHLIRSSLIC